MAKRLFDLISSSVALVLLSPVMLLAAILIKVSSPGPVFHRAVRVGQNGEKFIMSKFRTMHVVPDCAGSAITGSCDPRVFPAGVWLRRLKIDELPQLFDIIRGKMSVVGPRPEDDRIVEEVFKVEHKELFKVLPGLTSPGSIYYYSDGEKLLVGDDPEKLYAERLLPVKFALDVVYVREASFFYDIRIILKTIKVITLLNLGKKNFPEPPEMKKAMEMNLLDIKFLDFQGL